MLNKVSGAYGLLLVLVLAGIVTTLVGSSGLLPPDAAGAASTEGRGESEVDVLLGVEADDERGDVDDLLADAAKTVSMLCRRSPYSEMHIPDVPLADENTGVVDGLGEAELVDAGLEAALKEVLDAESQDVIELHARLVEDTNAHETADKGVTLEEALGILLVEREQRTAPSQQLDTPQ